MDIMLINYYGDMEATKKRELALVGGLIFIVYKRLEKKGINIRIGS